MPYKDKEVRKEYNKQYQKEWYQKNKAKHKANTSRIKKAQVIKMSQFVNDYKAERGCSRCPESDYVCLDFHHEVPEEKEITISDAIFKGWSQKRIQKELDKCIVICSNCHRKLHASEE